MNKSGQPSRVQFSLRVLLFLMALAAAYWAGWASHQRWNRRNLAETMNRLLKQVEARSDVKVETVEGTDIFITRGKKEDVDFVNEIMKEASEAAQK